MKIEIWELIQEKKELQWIKIDLKKREKKYCIINIYAPNHYRDKEVCWSTLKNYLMQDQIRGIIV